MKTLKAITAALIFSVALVGCGGGSAPDYAGYEAAYDNVPWFENGTGLKFTEEDFNEYAEHACSQPIEYHTDVVLDTFEGSSGYGILAFACGVDVAEDAMKQVEEPQYWDAVRSDWDTLREAGES